MKKMVVIRHNGCECDDSFEDLFRENGWEIENIELAKGEPLPDGLENVGGLMVLGGPINVYEQYTNPLKVYFNT